VKTILLVEDDIFIGMSEAKSLEKEGYNVIHIQTGEKAVDLINTDNLKIDLILMDIDLGDGIDGTATAGEILKSHDIPIVFLSSHTEKNFIDKTERIPSYGYVVKNSGTPVLAASLKIAFKLHKANRQLRESEERLEKAFSSSPIAMAITEVDTGLILYANKKMAELSGFTIEESIGRTTGDLGIFEYRHDRENVVTELRRKGSVKDVPLKLITKSNNVRDVLWSLETINMQGHDVILSTLVDITERNLAEKLLRESEERFSKAFHSSPVAMAISEIETGRYLNGNEKWADLIGYSIDEMIGRTSQELGIFSNKSDRARGVAELHRKGFVKDIPLILITKSGEIKDTLWSLEAINIQNREVLLSSLYDATEIRKANDKMKAMLQHLHDIIEFLPDPTFVIDKDNKVIYWNKLMENLTGVKKEEILGKGDYEYAIPFYNDRRPIMIDLIDTPEFELEMKYSNVKRAGNRILGELYFPHLNGGSGISLWGVAGPLFDSKGNRIGAIEILRDITDHKLAEDKLKEALQQMNDIIEFIPDPTFAINNEQKVIYWNRAMEDLSGVQKENILGKSDYEYAIPFYSERRPVLIDLVMQQHSEFEAAFDYIKRTGDKIYAEIGNLKINGSADVHLWGVASPLYNVNGEKIGAIEVIHDRTEHMQAEERYRSIVNSLPDDIFILSRDGIIIDYHFHNPSNINIPPERFLNKTLEEVFPDAIAEELHESIKLCTIKDGVITKEYDFSDNDKKLHYEIRMVPHGKNQLLAYVRDITFRKQSEMMLHNSLKEKTTLLQEVHHRVKNNMQLIISLLRLQSYKIENTEANAILRDCIQRVFTMAQIHEKIYKSENMASVDFKKYLEEIVSEILISYAPNPELINITLDIQDGRLSLKQAVPCGLMINEILTNAIKHGCPVPERSDLKLSFHCGENANVIIIQDNGPGIPEVVFTGKSTTLGMHIIHSLCQQLKADLSLENKSGTCYRITIPKDE
jgi:PAS domain S-box-containing protein